MNKELIVNNNMQEQNGNKYVNWKVFLGLVTIAILIISGAVTISVNALQQANANELKINGVKIKEELHYTELKNSLNRIEKDLKELLKK